MKKIFLFGSLFLISTFVLAENNSNFPANCVKDNFLFDNQRIILNNKAINVPQVFLFHNISSQNFWLDHPVSHPSASAGWASAINPNQWSALLLDQKSFSVTCTQKDAGKVQKLSCQKLLQVCELEQAKISPSLNGTFWLAENQSVTDLLKAIEKRGIGLD